MSYLVEESLNYHNEGRHEKTEVIPTTLCKTKEDLSLAYTPVVAYPCLEIKKNTHDVGKYTNRNNLVAVVSNRTVVLGLGSIGPMASKPVMEAKGYFIKDLPILMCLILKWQRKTRIKLLN